MPESTRPESTRKDPAAMAVKLGARMAALALVIATAAGCTQVKQTAADASAGLDRLFGSESKAEVQEASTQEAEQLYRAGLAERERGAKKAAFAQFLEAAELGHGPAAYETGMAYKDGRGTARDLKAGADWINKAAERGERRAQYLTGAAYYHGTGVEQNYEVAVGHLADAAVQDLPAAQFLLAEAFANGRGVAKNAPWAARWYGKAAAHGLPEAQYAYGVVHSTGLGLPQNPVRGYAWLRIAEGNGHKEAHRVADALEGKMSPEQLASAKARVAAFEPKSETRFADPPTVMYVERMLNSLGFKAGPVDGRLGKMSRAAIRKYQESRGLTADGKVKPKLLRSLLDEQKATA